MLGERSTITPVSALPWGRVDFTYFFPFVAKRI